MQLALNVGAMLLAFVALVSMANYGVEKIGVLCNMVFGTSWHINLQILFGYIFSPLCWVMGVPWVDCTKIGMLLGEKLAINEFVAYLHLADFAAKGIHLQHRSYVIISYALCGFANFSSIAIQIGGIGGMAPSRRHDLARVGLRAMFGGLLASLLSGTVAGLFV
jgi:CNT family concentrative nucleoside transporter